MSDFNLRTEKFMRRWVLPGGSGSKDASTSVSEADVDSPP